MDERWNNLLVSVLDDANTALVEAKSSYEKSGYLDVYIERLSKLTNIIMSVRTCLILMSSSTSMGFGSCDISKEE